MKSQTFQWGLSRFEIYKPKMNQYKRFSIFGFMALCLATPGTNWMLIPVGKLIKNNLRWFYK